MNGSCLNNRISPQAVPKAFGIRNCTDAAFASFKKDAALFLNTDFIGTKAKERLTQLLVETNPDNASINRKFSFPGLAKIIGYSSVGAIYW